MIWIYKEGKLCGIQTIREALENRIPRVVNTVKTEKSAPVISVVGAGGKTTILHQLAQEYVRAGEKVIVTTTTHIMDEGEEYFLPDPSVEKIKKYLKKFHQVWAGRPAPGGKLKGLEEPTFREILTWEVPVLIEADGAKRMPLKVPAEHEPVIPEQTTHVLSVYGLDAVGKPYKEVCFRSELVGPLLRKNGTDTVTAEDIAFLAASESGGRKRCAESAVYTVILNKADTPPRRECALEICRILEGRGNFNVIVTAFAVG